jgi:hypothetical protein
VRLINEKKCHLRELSSKGASKLKIGDELRVITRKGRTFDGILFDFKEGYLQTVSGLGILILFPLSALTNIYQL